MSKKNRKELRHYKETRNFKNGLNAHILVEMKNLQILVKQYCKTNIFSIISYQIYF